MGVEDYIKAVNDVLDSHPKLESQAKRYHIPPYDHNRHTLIMSVLQQGEIPVPTPQEMAQYHIFWRGNEKKPRVRKSKITPDNL